MKGPAYRHETFSTGDNLGYLLKMSHNLLHDYAETIFRDEDISFMQWLMLRKLQERIARTCSDLSRQLRHDTGALTRTVDQLQERGYVVRERSEEDRRVVELHLTDKGRAKLIELNPRVIALFNDTLDEFSDEEFAELNRLLKKLKSRLTDLCANQGVKNP